MGCYAKVDRDERNVTAVGDVTTGDNLRGGGGVGVPPTTTTTTTMTRAAAAAAAAATTMTGGLRNTSATATTAQYQRCWGRLRRPQRAPTGRRELGVRRNQVVVRRRGRAPRPLRRPRKGRCLTTSKNSSSDIKCNNCVLLLIDTIKFISLQ